MNSKRSIYNQPTHIKLINRIGEQFRKAGYNKPDLNTDRLIKHAKKKTGLQNFGDTSFRDGLQILTTELNEQAQLSQIGRIAAYYNLLDYLCVRLQLMDFRSRTPEVPLQQIKRPIFITGLPRTGTTILYELIAQDSSVRSPSSWEVTKPIPPPRKISYANDTRIQSVERMLALAEELSPGFRAIHTIGAKLPQECVYILASHFISEQYGYMYNIPKYRSWALNQDMTASYRWHANFLQHLQLNYGAAPWVLKAPAHLAYLKYLVTQYPDAAIVWTHRRPLEAISSFSSLLSTLQSGFSDTVNPVTIGEHEARHFSKIVNTGMSDRDALSHHQIFDVSFSSLCSDPISVIRRLYEYFEMQLSQEAENRMHEYLTQHPRHLHGEHTYSPAYFGLDEILEGELYPEYLACFDRYLH
ncbi:MAG: sulfotransferase [Halioglobus sp.]|nr:sulfotransferase [Halioglobus sp.]